MSRGIGNLPADGASVELYVMLEAPAGPVEQGKDLTYEIGYRSRNVESESLALTNFSHWALIFSHAVEDNLQDLFSARLVSYKLNSEVRLSPRKK